jgi:hypothetical protein
LDALDPLVATPEGFHHSILVLQKPPRAEHLIRIVVGIVAGAVSAKLLLRFGFFFHNGSSTISKSTFWMTNALEIFAKSFKD